MVPVKPRVLVVDDDSALAEMLGIVLRTDQFEPAFVADGSRALQAFRETKPDIVLLDLMLPGMSGIDVCRAIRAESGTPITARASLARVGWRVVPLVALGAVIPLAEGAGVFAFGIVSVWLWGVWAVAAPAFALERLGVVGALGRSFRLVDGAFWRTWGLRALGWVLTTVLGLFLTAPFEALAAYVTGSNPLDTGSQAINQPGLYVVILSIGGLLSAALLAPVASAVEVLIYTDLRMRKEDLDIVLGLPAVPVGTGFQR